jgi:hypothetical protein
MVRTAFFHITGLYHGKMGIVLFFAHYARYTGNMIYDDFAGELLDDILEELSEDLPINFEFGLCGIGWAVEYLIQNRFMEGNSNEILFEIDKKVMERNLLRVMDKSVQTGLAGISYYIDKRLHSSHYNQSKLPFDAKYLNDWDTVKEGICIPNDSCILSDILKLEPEGDIEEWKLGIERGCAGYGIKYLLK